MTLKILLLHHSLLKNLKSPKIELLPYHMFLIGKYKNLCLFNYIYKYEVPSNKTIKELKEMVENCCV